MRWLFALILALALPVAAAAEVAVVRGGEHPDFTRIVVDARGAGDWRLGRAEDGYELQLGPDVTGFDLTEAFERIPRDRVSALWRDPATGRLRFALSCPCHAIAFEFRPGTVVIDIKTGQPPAGSAFEEPLAPPPAAPEPEPEALAGDPADPAPGYDWLVIRTAESDEGGAAAAPLPLPMQIEDPRLDPLRAALLAQISRGAAEGIVGIAEHPALPDPAGARRSDGEGMRIVTGDLPGMEAATVHDPGPNLAADGGPCLSDSDLAVQDWLLPGPVAEQLGPGRAGLLGEFDAPQRRAILRAARLYIALGFGAEARQFLGLLSPPADDETRLLLAMSHVTDQEPGGEAAFSGMASCDTAAALWAAVTLTAAGGGTASEVGALNEKAVARSFSALPVHLRRHFGPTLVDLFLSAGEEGTARHIRDAILRAPGEAGPEVALMDAKFDLATGDHGDAAKIAGRVAREAGSESPQALVTLVEAAFRDGAPVPEDLPQVLDAYRGEARDHDMAARLARAHILAAALTGDFATAFAELPDSPETAADLWSLAAEGAGADLFLAEAVPAATRGRPPVTEEVALAVARRLQEIGFPKQALAWLGPVDAGADLPRRLLAAEAALALQDARAAAALVSGLDEPEAERIRAAAVLQLGDVAAAASALERAGDSAGAGRALTWAEDWAWVAESGPDPWKVAAALTDAAAAGPPGGRPVGSPPPDGEGTSLARGTALVADSASARAAVDALLASVAAPEAP